MLLLLLFLFLVTFSRPALTCPALLSSFFQTRRCDTALSFLFPYIIPFRSFLGGWRITASGITGIVTPRDAHFMHFGSGVLLKILRALLLRCFLSFSFSFSLCLFYMGLIPNDVKYISLLHLRMSLLEIIRFISLENFKKHWHRQIRYDGGGLLTDEVYWRRPSCLFDTHESDSFILYS